MESGLLQKLLASCITEGSGSPFVPIERIHSKEDLEKLGICPWPDLTGTEVKPFGNCSLCSSEGNVGKHKFANVDLIQYFKSGRSVNGPLCASCLAEVTKVMGLHNKKICLKNELEGLLIGIKFVQKQKNYGLSKKIKIENATEIETMTGIKIEIEEEEDIKTFLVTENVKEEEASDFADIGVSDEDAVQCTPLTDRMVLSVESANLRLPVSNDLNLPISRLRPRGILKRDGKLPNCYFCRTNLNDIRALNEHINGGHLGELSEACISSICNYRTAGRSAWRDHLRRNHKKEWKQWQDKINRKPEHKCVQCSKVFKSNSKLVRHFVMHKSDREKFPCNSCDKIFMSQDTLQHHRIRQHQNPLLRCPFKDCYSPPCHSQAYLDRHIRNVHEKKPVTCNYCDKIMKNEFALKMHKKNSKTCSQLSGVPVPLHRCPFPPCERSFAMKQCLKRHIRRVHDPDNQISKLKQKCVKCGKAFRLSDELAKHMNEAHGGISCPSCDKRFSSFRDFNHHHRVVHVIGKNKKYSCKIEGCGKSFLYPALLTLHVSTKHNKESQPPCYFCGQKFAGLPCLFDHLRGLHLEERPYSYSSIDCGFSSASKSRLNKHVNLKHP